MGGTFLGVEEGHGDGMNVFVLDVKVLDGFEELLDGLEDVLDSRSEELVDVVSLIVLVGLDTELDLDVVVIRLPIKGSLFSRRDATAKSARLASRDSNRIGSSILAVIDRAGM